MKVIAPTIILKRNELSFKKQFSAQFFLKQIRGPKISPKISFNNQNSFNYYNREKNRALYRNELSSMGFRFEVKKKKRKQKKKKEGKANNNRGINLDSRVEWRTRKESEK